MKTIMLVLAMAMSAGAYAADAEAPTGFNWRAVMGKTKDEATKMIEDAGLHYSVVVEDGQLQVTKQAKFVDAPCLDLIVTKGKVVGVILSHKRAPAPEAGKK